ncbi:MAG: MlaD family protein [Bacteroidales bacterium]|nr:MlaD family protein [Bacteroidales bacterium]HPB01974.1 MlaD family protein [Bacteroidales bacterium]HPE99955.1 MlaD family protein [Bacteroidales bacterium]
MFKKKEVRIALFFILGMVLVYWGINFLKGKDIFSNQTILYAEYENVTGLQEANPIMLNGYKIGQISEISFKPGGKGKLLVKMLLTEDVDIPSNSIAKIISSDLLGSKAMQIILGNSSEPVESGDYLKGETETDLKEEVSMQILPLKNKAEELLSSFDSVLVILQMIFNDDTRENLSRSFESIKNTIASLEHASYNIDTLVTSQRYRLGNIFANVESITGNLKENNDKIRQIFTNLETISDSLTKSNFKATINNANESLAKFNEVMTKVNQGQGSLGLLINNDTLYYNLERSSEDLDKLVEDMRLNPQRYLHFSIFGRSGKRNAYTPRD